jgi:putative transcriptional regulator
MKNIVRELRTDRGWSQGELADKLEVSRQTVNAIETGRYEPAARLRDRQSLRQADREDLLRGGLSYFICKRRS